VRENKEGGEVNKQRKEEASSNINDTNLDNALSTTIDNTILVNQITSLTLLHVAKTSNLRNTQIVR